VSFSTAHAPRSQEERTSLATLARDRALDALRRQIEAFCAVPSLRVLLVEDDPLFARTLTQSLRGLRGDIQVVRPLTPEDALRYATEDSWALAVLDMHLDHPSITGVTILRHLPRWVPVVLISGEIPETVHALAKRLKADAAFAKPFPLPAFLDKCRGLLPATQVSGEFSRHAEESVLCVRD